MIDGMTIEDRVRAIVGEHLGVELDKVTNESTLIGDLGADSIDEVELVMALEEDFVIAISDDEVFAADTVADWIKLVETKLA